MKAAHLQEAAAIVKEIEDIDEALTQSLAPENSRSPNTILLWNEKGTACRSPGATAKVYDLTRRASVAAHTVMVEDWRTRRAELVNRAAEIGLSL